MFERIEAQLVADWRWVLRRSWSVRWIAAAALLSGLEVALPYIIDGWPRGIAGLCSFACTLAAFVARFKAQSRED